MSRPRRRPEDEPEAQGHIDPVVLEAYLDTVDLPILLTIAETCAVLRISRPTFYRMKKAGKLEVVDVTGDGHSPRVTRRSIRRVIEGRLPKLEREREDEMMELAEDEIEREKGEKGSASVGLIGGAAVFLTSLAMLVCPMQAKASCHTGRVPGERRTVAYARKADARRRRTAGRGRLFAPDVWLSLVAAFGIVAGC